MNEITGRKAEGLSLANFMLYLYILCIILCIILNFMQNFENFAKVKFRDILLTGTGHQDRCLNRDCPGQTGTYGRFSYTIGNLGLPILRFALSGSKFPLLDLNSRQQKFFDI